MDMAAGPWGWRILGGLLLYKLVKFLRKYMRRSKHSVVKYHGTPMHLTAPEGSRVAGQRFGNQHPLYPEYFVNQQGIWIFTRRWEKPKYTPLKGIIILVHGFGEHSGRYDVFAKLIAEEGFDVYALDHQGHGRSEGERAYFERFSHLVDDVIALGKRALEDHAQSTPPLFILGHSMGGLIGAHAAQRASQGELAGFRGAVLSGPALTPDPEIAGPMLIKVGGVLSEMFPKVPLDGIPAQFVSRDPVVVEHYLNDPLNYVGGIRSRVGIELLQAMDAAQDMASSCTWPVLLLHGDVDKLCLVEGSQAFCAKHAGQDKELKVLKGQFHEIFNEPEGLENLQTCLDWILKRSAFTWVRSKSPSPE